jgi:uncharacterized cupin superfamily protein
MTRRHTNVINADEVEPRNIVHGRHSLTVRSLAQPAGSRQLGAALTTVPPGHISFPAHYHCASEEAIYVLSGTGVARIGADRFPVRPGDWLALPVGPDHAHQMINDGTEPLTYLCMSTTVTTDVVFYPDSNKVNVFGSDSSSPRGMRHFGIYQREDGKDFSGYWDREPEAG